MKELFHCDASSLDRFHCDASSLDPFHCDTSSFDPFHCDTSSLDTFHCDACSLDPFHCDACSFDDRADGLFSLLCFVILKYLRDSDNSEHIVYIFVPLLYFCHLVSNVSLVIYTHGVEIVFLTPYYLNIFLSCF